MQILNNAIDDLQVFQKEDCKSDLFDMMSNVQDKLNNYNSCDRIKIINEAMLKQKSKITLNRAITKASQLSKKSTRNIDPDFFKNRNSSSAFDKIGTMGEVQSKLAGESIAQYRTFLEKKRSQTRGIFEPKKGPEYKPKENMLEYIRKGKETFLVPMVLNSRNSCLAIP